MLKFFRKIRLNVLSEGITGKYLKYAFGEIILVVFGILIALQINNWNEQKKIDRSINSHLEILKQNLKEDQNQLVDLKENITIRKNCADSAMLQIQTIVHLDYKIKKYLIMLYQEFNFSPNTNAIETITQSNEIPALSEELRTAILDYYALIERTKEREDVSNTQIQTKYEPYVNLEYPNIFEKDNEWDFIAEFYKNDPRPVSSFDNAKFLKDKSLETMIVSRYYQTVILSELYGELIDSSNEILSLLEK